MSSRTVLVVEDDPNVGQLIVNLLEARGIATSLVTDGLQALERLQADAPAAVVLDLALPLVDGWEVLNTLQEAERDIPIIVVTAHGQGDGAKRAKELGVRRFFEKPFIPSQLATAVAELLDETSSD